MIIHNAMDMTPGLTYRGSHDCPLGLADVTFTVVTTMSFDPESFYVSGANSRDPGELIAAVIEYAYGSRILAFAPCDVVYLVSSLCTDCVTRKYHYEPDMGDDNFTFAPGKCDLCGDSRGVVWTPQS